MPKITQWLQLQSVSEPEESQSHSCPLGITEKRFTADMNQQLSTHSFASNDVQPEAVDYISLRMILDYAKYIISLQIYKENPDPLGSNG